MPSVPIIVGIPAIGAMIQDGDPRMSPYFQTVNLDNSYDEQLAQAIAFSSAFIGACGGQEANEIDPEKASGIGGNTLIATVTPGYGFRWVPDLGPHDSLSTNK
jgi:hypothetical protein